MDQSNTVSKNVLLSAKGKNRACLELGLQSQMGTNVGTSSKDSHIMELLSSLVRLLGSKVRVQVKVSRDYGHCLGYKCYRVCESLPDP